MPSSDVDNRNNANRPVTGSLHPRVYTVLIGLALWMALWAWSFVGGGETDYILFIVTGFIVVVWRCSLFSCASGAPTNQLMPTTVTARTAYRHSINGLRENLRPSVAACAPSKRRY